MPKRDHSPKRNHQHDQDPTGLPTPTPTELPEGWKMVRLREVGRVITGRTPSTSNGAYWNGPIPFITPVDLKGAPIRAAQRSITEEGLHEAKPLPKGTVLVSCIGYIGKVGVVDSSIAVTNQQINAVIPEKADNWFLAFALMYEAPLLESQARMTTVPILHKTNFERIFIPLPPLPEQRAIARVLSTLQRAIETQDQLIAAARALKRALMRHLFTYGAVPPAQAERVPLKETEIGAVPEGWEVVKLGDVCEKPQYGYTESAKEKPVGPKFLRITDIQNGGVNWSLVPHCEINESLLEKYALKDGDVVIARIGATTGKSYFISNPPRSVFASYLIRVRAKTGLFPEYLSYFADTETYWKQINESKGGRLKQGVNIPVLTGLRLQFPPLPEQRAIARILSAVDKKIAAEEKRKAALQTLFKTMLHQLMTGQIRVKDK